LTQLDATSAVAIELGLAGHAGACNCGGFPAGYEASAWYGIAAPAGTPAAIVERYPESDSGSGPAARSATMESVPQNHHRRASGDRWQDDPIGGLYS